MRDGTSAVPGKFCCGVASGETSQRNFHLAKRANFALASKDENIRVPADERICGYGKFWVLTDGCAVTEQADGTLFVEGKKFYLSDENGEPSGAAWCDLWITSDGKVVRKTRPISKDEMEME